MPWFAQFKGGNGYIAICTTPWNAGYQAEHPQNGPYTHVSVRFEPSLGRMDYRRIVRYTLIEDGDYNDACKIYRQYVKEQGNLCTLNEKAARVPSVNDLIGCSFIHKGIKTFVQPESDFFDPENPVNQIFFMLKMEPMFPDENSRAMMALSSDLFGKYPILTNVSTQGVFEIFPQFADAMNATADYADIQTPYIADFSVTESFESTQGMSSVAISPSILRADFTQNGTTGEGMFTADVVPFAMGTGMGYYSVYNLTVLSAEKGTFQDWQPTLNKVLSSLNYTPEFQSFAMSQSNQAASTSQSLSQSASEMSDSIMSSWENRNRSQDIMSQKQSDATLGYERIVDTETGNIYKIDNGFTDWYDGSRYKSITDDQYTDSVEAVIHWK